ncbi:hypothetical protein [Corynebacterium crudilactis]|uniref:Uncharacterized protein n=1 Tax=Corynebacterium crudilactis TaxID=1652495 RepID=A0A172QQN5_9CORY|nr:hypothetical protein [Corynebacterium crudilactis]ANE03005.1 hypothetical protein ccrud_01420 [Corynebacterium crudilactis]
MKTLPRFAPLITILALLVLVAIGGSALANNRSTPQVESEPATISQHPATSTARSETQTTEPNADSQPGQDSARDDGHAPHPAPAPVQASVPAQAPAPAPAPTPAYVPPAPAPQVPLNYQYYDDDWDDDDYDDWDDDDWDDDGDND